MVSIGIWVKKYYGKHHLKWLHFGPWEIGTILKVYEVVFLFLFFPLSSIGNFSLQSGLFDS